MAGVGGVLPPVVVPPDGGVVVPPDGGTEATVGFEASAHAEPFQDHQPPDLGQRPEARVLLVERLAPEPIRTTHQGERPAIEVRQHRVGDRHVVEREV